MPRRVSTIRKRTPERREQGRGAAMKRLNTTGCRAVNGRQCDADSRASDGSVYDRTSARSTSSASERGRLENWRSFRAANGRAERDADLRFAGNLGWIRVGRTATPKAGGRWVRFS